MLTGYLINLNRHPHRLLEFFQHPDAKYFERIPAVDKKLLELFGTDSLFFNTDKVKQKIGRPITLGEIGCTLSHILCWEKIASNPNLQPQDFAVIAEDDICLIADFAHILRRQIDQCFQHSSLNLVLLHKLGLCHSQFKTAQNGSDFELIQNGDEFLFDNDGSGLYLIRKRKAQELIEGLMRNKPSWLADHFSEFCPLQEIGLINPLLASISSQSISDLEEDRQIARRQTDRQTDRIETY